MNFSKALKIQSNVINALVYRELKTRVSEVRFGVIGVFIEPVGVMAVFLLIFSFIRGNRGSLDVSLFLGSGIVLYTLFNEIAIRSLNAMLANEALFFYRPVKPIDTVIARTIVESGLYAIVYIAIIVCIFLIKETLILDDIPLLVFSYVSLLMTSAGVGLIMMVAGHRYPSLYQIVPLILRPLWFISGVFFSLESVPQSLRPLLSWNPILQSIELSRHAFSKSYVISNSVSILYLSACAMLSLTLGLYIYINNEKLLLTR